MNSFRCLFRCLPICLDNKGILESNYNNPQVVMAVSGLPQSVLHVHVYRWAERDRGGREVGVGEGKRAWSQVKCRHARLTTARSSKS